MRIAGTRALTEPAIFLAVLAETSDAIRAHPVRRLQVGFA
jgi:hypothetical protein